MVTQLLPLQVLTTLLLGTALVVSCVMRRHGPPLLILSESEKLDLSENCLAQNSMVYQPLAIYHDIYIISRHTQILSEYSEVLVDLVVQSVRSIMVVWSVIGSTADCSTISSAGVRHFPGDIMRHTQ
jgi:hypothetical protein